MTRHKNRIMDYSPLSHHDSSFTPDASMQSFEALRPDPSRYFEIRKFDFQESCFSSISVASKFRIRWDIFICFLAVFESFAVPFRMAFMPESFSNAESIAVTSIIDLFFFADLLLNFRTTFYNPKTGDEVHDPKEIRMHYLTSYSFYTDLATTIPWDKFIYLVMLGTDFGFDKASSIMVIRIIRIVKFDSIINNIQVRDDIKVIVRMVQLIFYLLVYVHVIACFWKVIVDVEETWFPPSDGKDTNFYYSGTSIARKYMFCLYHSVYFLRGVETNPSNTSEVTYLIFVILMGSIISAIMFGQMSVLMGMLARSRLKFAQLMDTAQTTMKNIKLDESLQFKITDYLLATQTLLAQQEEIEHFAEVISPSLQQEVNSHIYRNIAVDCPLINKIQGLDKEVIKKLTNKFVQPETNMTVQGEDGSDMYYVSDGTCVVTVLDEHKVSHTIRYLKKGQFFGEVAIIFDTTRTATVSTLNYCNIAALNAKSLKSLVQAFPKLTQILKNATYTYVDHWKVFLFNSIEKIPFLIDSSDEFRHALIYSMQTRSLGKYDVLFDEGQVADKIFILVEGKLRVYATVASRKFKWTIEKQAIASFDQGAEGTARIKNIGRKMTMMRKERVGLNAGQVSMKLESLNVGSVLCLNQALVNSTYAVSCRSAEPSTVLYLSMEKLEKLAKARPKLKLRIDQVKEKLMYRDTESGEIVRDVPLIDIQKNIPDKNLFRVWNNFLKFKNRVLDITLRKRTLHILKISDLKGLVIKLKAINQANDAGYPDLARKIALGEADVEAVKTIGILDSREMSNPLLTQFAAKVASVREVTSSVEQKLKSVQSYLKLKHQNMTSLQSNMTHISSLLQALDESIF
mmetsp:Transcript_26614/g.47861  ORF Transcript_26614/g.47861 Transcript_26614/m.47861 type:complete len:855 (-) Transcript_26614:1837-4401(-)